jgi:hypothetical protein
MLKFGRYGALSIFLRLDAASCQTVDATRANYRPDRYPFNGTPLARSFLSYSEDYDLLQSAPCKLASKYNPFEVRLGSPHRTSKRMILQSVNYNVYSDTLTRLQGDLKFDLRDAPVIKRPNRDYLTQKDRDRSRSNNLTILAKAPGETAARPRVLIESMIDAIEADKLIELLNKQISKQLRISCCGRTRSNESKEGAFRVARALL